MSAEFAVSEGCPVHKSSPSLPERLDEIRRLEKFLDAILVLESVSQSFKGFDIPLMKGFEPTHYLIRYNRVARTVTVEPYDRILSAITSYDPAEAVNSLRGDTENVVLVEADKVKSLRSAYPNYFGDVELFKAGLKQVVKGNSLAEYANVPRQPPPRREVVGDTSWLRRNKFAKPDALPGRRRKRK
jgi:hypothetical protein